LTIETTDGISADLSIVNMLGAVMYEQELQEDDNATLQVNTGKWPAGVYIVRINDGVHSALMKKFVKE
jgi:hypothetical protein